MTYVARVSEGRLKVGVRGEPGEVLLFLRIRVVQKRADYCRKEYHQSGRPPDCGVQ
jgi:hypothetical protein